MAGEAECLMGCPYTAQKRVEALISGASGSDTRGFIAVKFKVQSQKSTVQNIKHQTSNFKKASSLNFKKLQVANSQGTDWA
jgi:hypothetical protein